MRRDVVALRRICWNDYCLRFAIFGKCSNLGNIWAMVKKNVPRTDRPSRYLIPEVLGALG